MYKIDTSSPVLVTGATGYVAGWIIKELLEAGICVHAGIRDITNTEKYAHLDKIAKHTKGEIKYFQTNLLQDNSYADAMLGCSIVFHTASPFTINVTDPQKELVDPAVIGTKNVLLQANKTPSVERVVLTSSCAAIYGSNSDIEKTPNHIFTEEMWNTSSTLHHNPYSFSKTQAEKEAWAIAKAQNQWDLVTINPSLVMGPGLNPHATSESFNIIRQMGDGSMKSGVPDWAFGMVDVRDVAKAHIGTAYTKNAKGRYIVSAHNTTLLEMAQQLLPQYGKTYPIPRRLLPKFLVWLMGPIMTPGITRKFISQNIGYKWRADNTKSISDLGIAYRSQSETMNNFFEQMIESGQIKAKK